MVLTEKEFTTRMKKFGLDENKPDSLSADQFGHYKEWYKESDYLFAYEPHSGKPNQYSDNRF